MKTNRSLLRNIFFNAFSFLKALVFASSCYFFAFTLHALDCEFKKLTVLTKATYMSNISWEHNALIKSLKKGLIEQAVSFNYNPTSLDDIGDVIFVPCDHKAVVQAVELKRQKRIKKLLVGPNIWPDEINYPEVDVYFVPSAWVIEFVHELCPNMESRCKVWYAGVDQDFWKQSYNDYKYSKDVLVYWKTEGIAFCTAIEELLINYGWNPVRLKYGSYNTEQYKNVLRNCRFAVFISRSESQGLALAECWSMDVPTLPWNPKSTVILGHQCDYVSSCPYLNDKLGKDWKTLNELEAILQSIDVFLFSCAPREWVMNFMTDEVSVKELIKIINTELIETRYDVSY